ncbi:hypothetical protein, partial [Candidatus Thiosymbion oneisti]|uniref:hypothetical protein n=1 Tax=Candidatus Thiosymbion oneisti TaxID=589554 RepID=UPI001A9C2F10
VRRQSGATESNLSDGEYQRRWPGIRALSATRAAATALSSGHNTLVGNGYLATSKAAAGWCHLADPRLMPRAVGSGKQRGEVAAALQNVRGNPSMIVGSPESIKSLSC